MHFSQKDTCESLSHTTVNNIGLILFCIDRFYSIWRIRKTGQLVFNVGLNCHVVNSEQ